MSNYTFSVLTPEPLKHFGVCDASAAIPFGENHFIVGNDEADEILGNILKVYPSQKSGQATHTITINDFVNTSKEIDLEAVTEIDGINYWITSHGRNKSGKKKPKRHQFFATKLTGDEKIVKQVGKSYQQLVFQDMINNPLLASLELKKAETIAPKKKGGLNIEGLTATPKGELLIGFRNPIPNNKALLIPLKNPLDLVSKEEDDIKAEFGEPMLLDLNGFGIRSIEYWSTIQSYIIIAGAFDGSNEFTIYSWSGKNDEQPQPLSIPLPEDFRPESVLFYPHLEDRLQILSDDGAVERIDGKACKDIEDKDSPEKYFRSIWVKLN